MEDVSFYGWDLIRYYWYLIQNQFAGVPWQIAIAYILVIGSSITLVVLGILFWNRVRKRNKIKKRQDEVNEKYSETIRTIITSGEMSPGDILALMKQCENLDADEIKDNARYFISIIVSIRTEIGAIAYFPNLQSLVDVSGVREYCEQCLLHNNNVFEILQMMAMTQIVITEGRLANYLNARDTNIRMMARLSYIVCSMNDPYKYLEEDLEEEQSPMRSLMLHYIFAWMKDRGKKMPNFITIANTLKNEDTAAFMIKEAGYWGTQEELDELPKFFTSPRSKCKEAAIDIVYLTNSNEGYNKLIKIYPNQSDDIKMSILEALAFKDKKEKDKDKKYNDFFIEAFNNTAAKEVKERALTCLYLNGGSGLCEYTKLRGKITNKEDVLLLNKIESINLLDTYYNLNI